jgi:ADP-ribose pyrophosphatase YjhB (NUDIX family)
MPTNARERSIPGGTMEPSESIADTIVREVREETGIEARIEKLLGVYSNPRHVSVYDDGEVRQQFSVCFLCRAAGGGIRTSEESSEVRFIELAETERLEIHPSIRLRIQHYAENRPEPVIA